MAGKAGAPTQPIFASVGVITDVRMGNALVTDGFSVAPDDPRFPDLVIEIARLAVAEAIAEHHAAGRSVFYQRDGELVEATPDGREIPVDTDKADCANATRGLRRRR